MKKYTAESDFSKGPAILKFSADWCAPCKALTPVMDELLSGRDDIASYEVDIDEHYEISELYGIRGVPTVIFFKDGAPVEQIVGLRAKETYIETLNSISA